MSIVVEPVHSSPWIKVLYSIFKEADMMYIRRDNLCLFILYFFILNKITAWIMMHLAYIEAKILRKRADSVSCVIWEEWKVSPIFFCNVNTFVMAQQTLEYSGVKTMKTVNVVSFLYL